MSYCLINKSNYFNNLSIIEQHIDKAKIAVVIKNNAYGHGIVEIANLAKEYGIKHSVVCTIKEANLVSDLFETILVLQDLPNKKNKENIIITINSIDDIKKLSIDTKVEIEVDTGMSRNGITINEIPIALDMIMKNKLILHGVFTHFSSAFKEDSSLNIQKDKFDNVKNLILNDNRFDNVRFHCSSSSSLFRVDNLDYDLARIGIASYGYVSLPKSFIKPKLKPVMSLWAEKITSKNLSKGDAVGYGLTYKLNQDMKVSTYDIGYGDGIVRLDQSRKSHIEDGRQILGVVSMNSFTVEGEDNHVCVFENAKRFSKVANTIVYDFISNINPLLERKIVEKICYENGYDD